MRWAARTLLALVVLALLLAGAAFFAPVLLKPRVEAAASRALGRPVTIASLQLLPAWPPVVEAKGVQASGLGTVQRLDAQIQPGSLLAGAPRIAVLTLLRPDLHASIASLDPANKAPGIEPSARPSSGAHPPAAHRRPLVDRIVVEEGQVRAADPRDGQTVSVTVSGAVGVAARAASFTAALPAQSGLPAATLSVQADSERPVHADLTTMLRGQPVQLHIDSGTPEQLLRRQAVPVTLTATIPGATLTAKGTLAAPRYDLAISLRAANEAALAALAGVSSLPAGPLSADVHATGDLRQAALHGLSLAAPQGDLSGDAVVSLQPPWSLSGVLASKRLDVDAILASLPRRQSPPPTAALRPAQAPPATIIPGRPLPFGALARLQADLTLTAASLHLGGISYTGFSGHLAASGGRIALAPFSAAMPGGARLDATAHLDTVAVPPAIALTVQAPAVALAPLLASLRLPPAATGTAAVAADLRAAGTSLHAMAASLEGTASLRMAGGTLEGGALALILRATRLPIPLKEAGHAGLRCLALGAEAKGGVLTIAPLVADAGRVLIGGSGTVDLGQETLNLHLRPLLRTGPGLVVPLSITGSWRDPSIASDASAGAPGPGSNDACQAAGIAVPASAPPATPKKLPNSAEILRRLFR